MKSVRRDKIREFVEANNIVTVEQLTGLLPEVSLMTIHRDLSYLQEQGVLQKIRGGARYLGSAVREPAFSAREIVNKRQKQMLSQKAVSLLGGADSIFIDSGTTMTTFSRLLPDKPMHIVTTSPNIAIELSKKRYPAIDVCGGALNKSNLTLSGSAAIEMLSRLNIDTAFLVASGYALNGGFTCGRESESDIKSLVLEKARRRIILMDTSKFEKILPHTFGRLNDVDYLVTESDPDNLPEDLIKLAKTENVTLI